MRLGPFESAPAPFDGGPMAASGPIQVGAHALRQRPGGGLWDRLQRRPRPLTSRPPWWPLDPSESVVQAHPPSKGEWRPLDPLLSVVQARNGGSPPPSAASVSAGVRTQAHSAALTASRPVRVGAHALRLKPSDSLWARSWQQPWPLAHRWPRRPLGPLNSAAQAHSELVTLAAVGPIRFGRPSQTVIRGRAVASGPLQSDAQARAWGSPPPPPLAASWPAWVRTQAHAVASAPSKPVQVGARAPRRKPSDGLWARSRRQPRSIAS